MVTNLDIARWYWREAGYFRGVGLAEEAEDLERLMWHALLAACFRGEL